MSIALSEFIGKPMKEIYDILGSNKVSINRVNAFIEVKDVSIYNWKELHHAIVYYDLSNRDIMTMVIVKLENLNFIDKLNLRFLTLEPINGYIPSITFQRGRKDVLITYVKENILKNIM